MKNKLKAKRHYQQPKQNQHRRETENHLYMEV